MKKLLIRSCLIAGLAWTASCSSNKETAPQEPAPAPAVQPVIALVAVDPVIAVAAMESVIARAAIHQIAADEGLGIIVARPADEGVIAIAGIEAVAEGDSEVTPPKPRPKPQWSGLSSLVGGSSKDKEQGGS